MIKCYEQERTQLFPIIETRSSRLRTNGIVDWESRHPQGGLHLPYEKANCGLTFLLLAVDDHVSF